MSLLTGSVNSVCVCVYRGVCREEEAHLCADRSGGKRYDGCSRSQTDGQEQDHGAAVHLPGVRDDTSLY